MGVLGRLDQLRLVWVSLGRLGSQLGTIWVRFHWFAFESVRVSFCRFGSQLGTIWVNVRWFAIESVWVSFGRDQFGPVCVF